MDFGNFLKLKKEVNNISHKGNKIKKKIVKIRDTNLKIDYMENFFKDNFAKKLFNDLDDIQYDSEESSSISIFGKIFKIPRKQVSFGDPKLKYMFSGNIVYANDWNATKIGLVLKKIAEKLEKMTNQKYNYVLVNNYENCSNSIGYHSDDEGDLVKNAIIAGISLGSTRKIKFKCNKTVIVKDIILNNNSLFLMRNPTNKFWKHSIPKTKKKIGKRISLTFRCLKS
jgi:alkylated DNA repair dioxygenase AlkB